MSNKIDTVLFDLDVTLIDTNELIISSFLHTMETYYPGQYKREDVLPFLGPSLQETFQPMDPEGRHVRSARASNTRLQGRPGGSAGRSKVATDQEDGEAASRAQSPHPSPSP